MAEPAAEPPRLAVWRERLGAWLATPRGRAVRRWGGHLLRLFILGAIVLQLSGIGWREVAAHLPTSPLFYLLMLGGYLTLPTTETLIYRRLWGVAPRDAFWTMIRKRLYNQFVVDYSGEVLLFGWGRRVTGRSAGDVGRDVRDVNILSNVSSIGFALVLVVGLVAAGLLDFEALFGVAQPLTWAVVAFLLVLFGAVAVRFRRHLFALPWRTALAVFGLHAAQTVTVQTAKWGQWVVGAPEVGALTWLIFLAAAVVVERLPLPNKDFVFVGAGVGLAGALAVAEAQVAGVLLVQALGVQVLHLTFFGLAFGRERLVQFAARKRSSR